MARRRALVVTVVTLAATVVLALNCPAGDKRFAAAAFSLPAEWGPITEVRLALSLDKLSLWLFGLSGVLAVGVALIGWKTIDRRAPAFYRLLLALEAGMLATFAADDVVLFLFCCELILVLLFFIIGLHAGRLGHRAAVRFITFSTVGSGLVLLGLLALVTWDCRCGPGETTSFSITRLTGTLVGSDVDPARWTWTALSLALGFAVIGTQFHWNAWIRRRDRTPPAGAEYPKPSSTAACRLLVSCAVLELGAYGLLRFVLPLLQETTALPTLCNGLQAGFLAERLGPTPSEAGTVAAVSDVLAACGRWLPWLLGALLLPLFWRSTSIRGAAARVGLLLCGIAGLAMATTAEDLVPLFVAVEIIAVAVCLSLYLDGRRRAMSHASRTSAESVLGTYLLPGVFASAMLLYGFVLIFNATGSTRLTAIAHTPAQFMPAIKIALGLVLAGLGFRIAAVPFHFHVPRVLEESGYANATLLSVIVKAAGLVVLARLLVSVAALPHDAGICAWPVIAALAAVTMTWGSAVALRQSKLRSFMAYGSIAQTGLMLMALAAVSVSGGTLGDGWNPTVALLFYLCVYSIAMIGLLAVFTCLRREDRSLETVDELAGLGRSRPLVAGVMALFMLSLAGIAPLAGFWGKLLVLASLLGVSAGNGQAWLIVLAVVGVLNFAAMAACYLRIVALMYFRTPLAVPKLQGGLGARCTALVCAVLLLVAGLFPGLLIRQMSDPLSDPRAGVCGPKAGATAENAKPLTAKDRP